MARESSETTRRTALHLAWNPKAGSRRGPRPTLTLDAIVAATVELADAGGIEAVSMGRLAKRVGLTPMALYRYVTRKDELLFLAVDAAVGWPPPGRQPGEGWRPAVERWARTQLDRCEAHPWVARVPVREPPLGPHQVAWMEQMLESLVDSGLSDVDQVMLLGLLAGFVLGHFRLTDDLTRGAQADGMTREEAERRYFETLGQVIDPARHPRVAAAFGAAAVPSADPRADFEFGLARILDGVELLAGERSRPAADWPCAHDQERGVPR